jgi:hypothetical protein
MSEPFAARLPRLAENVSKLVTIYHPQTWKESVRLNSTPPWPGTRAPASRRRSLPSP